MLLGLTNVAGSRHVASRLSTWHTDEVGRRLSVLGLPRVTWYDFVGTHFFITITFVAHKVVLPEFWPTLPNARVRPVLAVHDAGASFCGAGTARRRHRRNRDNKTCPATRAAPRGVRQTLCIWLFNPRGPIAANAYPTGIACASRLASFPHRRLSFVRIILSTPPTRHHHAYPH